MKHTRRWPLFYVTILLIACTNRQPVQKDTSVENNLYSTTKEDDEMNRAIGTAIKTFPRFDSAFRSGKIDSSNFSIKVRFPDPRGNEYIWLTEISKANGHYQGSVSDTPRLTRQVRLGDRYGIPEKDIVDWMYFTDSIAHGAYTTRVILGRMSKEERAEAELGFPYKIED